MNEVVKKESLPVAVKSGFNTDFFIHKLEAAFVKDESKKEDFKSALITISQDKNLANCNVNTIFSSAFCLASLGLSLNKTLGLGYVLKYKQDAQPVISYKGWQVIASRAGIMVKADSVFSCDEFSRDLSSFDEKIVFKPADNNKERKPSNDEWYLKNLTGVLVRLKDTISGFEKSSFVPADKLAKIRNMSPSANSSFSPHKSWAEEMNRAKAIKYVLSKEPLDEKRQIIAQAVSAENEFIDIDAQSPISAPKITQSDLNAIAYEQGEGQIIDENGEVLNGEER